jgi:tryptophan-rich sensory protein
MPWIEWYNSLAKPPWTPAPSTISLIWALLYPVILVSFGFVFVRAYQGRLCHWRQRTS